MKVNITPYEWFLNIFTLSILGGLGYMIWCLGAGLPWYWRVGFIVGLFAGGALLSIACAHGFGAQVVYVINPQDRKP